VTKRVEKLPRPIHLTENVVARHRASIHTGLVLKRLQRHILREDHKLHEKMSATQIRAAEILLRKTIPDLSAVEHSMNAEPSNVREYSTAELFGILRELDRERSERIAAARESNALTVEFHEVHDTALVPRKDPSSH
jgi:hypothetical protein